LIKYPTKKGIGIILSLALMQLMFAFSVGKTNGIIDLKAYNLPKYETVVDQFFEKYSNSDPGPGEILYFEKKPTGWYISILDHNLGR
jgi:hypothetical protein